MSRLEPVYLPGTPREPCMSGAALLDGLRSLEEIVGPEVLEAAKAKLSPSDRQDLASATTMSWIPATIAASIFEEAARITGQDEGLLLDAIVRRTAERLLTGLWRPLLRLTTEEAMVKRSQAIYARGRNTGQLSSRIVEPGCAIVELTGWSSVSDRQLRMIATSNQVLVELAGRKFVGQTYTRTPDGARFELRWRR